MLNFYPPFLFQRIRCLELAPDFHSARIRISKSLLNRNLNGTVFGGTIYTAVDPLHSLMYWQHFAHQGRAILAAVRGAEADFPAPAHSRLHIDFAVSEADLAGVESDFAAKGYSVRTHTVEAIDKAGTVCAVLKTATYLKPLGTNA